MTDTKISGLTDAGTLDGTEQVPVVKSSTTKRSTVQKIMDFIFSGLTAKGSFFAASAAGTPSEVTVGQDGWVVYGDSAQTAGLGFGPLALKPRASSSTETLTANDTGKTVITGTASTLTLPLLSAVKDGALIGFILTADVEVTVQRQSSDTLAWPGAAALNSVKLEKTGDYLLLYKDSTAWRVISEKIQGPSFQAQYNGTGQNIGTNTATKLQFNTEISDSHGCYDAATNYRFTPTIPGWYDVTVVAYISCAAAGRAAVILYKNGSEYSYGQRSYTQNDGVYDVSIPVYLNGSTDYIEAYGISIDNGGTFDDAIESNFIAVRIR